MANRVGQQLGNYRLLRLIGTGGFAEVYLAEHQYLRTQAAIKVLHTQLTDEDLEYFLVEARTVAHLLHPHIVRVLEFGVEGTTPFLVMDYAPNGTLRQHHAKGSQVPLVMVVSYVKQLASALDYAHSQHVIHRDIKPENMLIGSNHTILLGDFGIAQVAQSSRYQNVRDMAGTISYMAPEQIKTHPLPVSDQYSLAVVVYEWLCGKRPFEGSFTEIAVKHALVAPASLRESVPTLPFAVEQVVLTALAKEPNQRFATVQAFATALEFASHVSPTNPVTPSWLSRQINDDTPTLLTPQRESAASGTMMSQPHNVVTPHIAAEATTMMSQPHNGPTSPITVDGMTVMSQPYPLLNIATPPRQSVVASAPVVAHEVTSVRRRGFTGGKVIAVLVVLLLIVAGSTGIFYTVLARNNAGTKVATPTTHVNTAVTPHTTPQGSPTAVPVAAQDTFQRADQQFWGTASDGSPWQGDTDNHASFSIKDKAGQIIGPTQGGQTLNALLGPVRQDSEVVFSGSVNHFNPNVNIGSMLRWNDEKNWYKALIDGTNLTFLIRVNGVEKHISVPFAAKDNTRYTLRFRVVGTTLAARVWQTDQQEPQTWMLRTTDASLPNGTAGLRFRLAPGAVMVVNSFVVTKEKMLPV